MMPRVISTCSTLMIFFCVAAAYAQPDLAVRSVDAAGVVGDWQALTISGSVDVEVANVGGAGAPTVPLIVFEDRDGSGSLTAADKVLGVAQTPVLGLQGKVVLTVPVSGDLRFRDNLIFAVVDPDNLNGESVARRANNVGNSAVRCADPIPSVPFSIAFKGEWPGDEISYPDALNILTTPMVADLDGDGLVEIIFVATDSTDGSALTAGVLRVISGDGLFEVFTISEPNLPINATAPLAIGDLDGDGRLEIVVLERSDELQSDPSYPARDRVYWNSGARGAAANHWVEITLSGRPAAELVGAKLLLRPRGDRVEILGRRDLFPSAGTYKTSQDSLAHFGLGPVADADLEIVLYQPGAAPSPVLIEGIPTDRRIRVDVESREVTVLP